MSFNWRQPLRSFVQQVAQKVEQMEPQPEYIDAAVREYLTEEGAQVGYSVTDGNLAVNLTGVNTPSADVASIGGNPIVPESVAANSVTDAMLAQSAWDKIDERASNPLATVGGSVATTDYATVGKAFASIIVNGKSTQSATPSPNSPAPISSIESLSVRVSGKDTSDYDTTAVNLSGNVLRSLSDGTADTIEIDEAGNATLTRRVGTVDLGTFNWAALSSPSSHVYRVDLNAASLEYLDIAYPTDSSKKTNAICTEYLAKAYNPLNATDNGYFAISSSFTHRFSLINTSISDIDTFMDEISGVTLQYQLKTPVTVSLGSVTAPTVPDGTSNVWAVATPETTVSVVYPRDLSAIFGELDEFYRINGEVTLCKNLVGEKLGAYYPIPKLSAGDKLTFSTSTGEPLPDDESIVVHFYDGDKNFLDYYAFNETHGASRTITVSSIAGATFVRITELNANALKVPIQIELGDAATGYEPYFGNTAYLFNEVEGLKGGDMSHLLDNARHVPYASLHAPSLTILHMSDVHADKIPYSRILRDAEGLGASVDDIICTGDMVANKSGQIASWWDGSVMTCIGNHDTASYSADTGYDWTALSMADRSAYYIEPFESGWGVTHTSGTSYYYKDYADSDVRLIVMDCMLYMGNATTTEAATQTSWLEGLLSDAITNELHVLIAAHAPHGGASPVSCSFTKLGQGTMPTYQDANLPQAVIDTVASAITGGLNFIGYLVGHTHIDTIWDTEGDGKQLMYCVTCATTSVVGSDQHRYGVDAYNLVTIDTYNKLVKIVRGGGADVDDKMRSRKAICISYDTGTVVGEVL